MAITLFVLTTLFTICYNSHDPSGVCFAPTRLETSSQELSNPLISPGQQGYDKIWNEFIDPILKIIPPHLGIINSSMQFLGKSKGKVREQKRKQYRNMKKSVEVYYVDQPEIDFTHGIWGVSFGQFIFKFTEPIPGIPDTVIFNGLLPAVGITHTSIQEWQHKYPHGKPADEESDEKHAVKTTQKPKRKLDESAESEESEESEDDRRRLAADESSDTESHDSAEGSHEPGKVDGESPKSYEQYITPNGFDGNNLEFWVVHSDPNDKTAFAVAARTCIKTAFAENCGKKLFSRDWVEIDDYCRKHGSTSAVEEKGECDGLISEIGDAGLEDLVAESKWLRKNKYCTKIVLCKNGAFKFIFKQHAMKVPVLTKNIKIAVAKLDEDHDAKFQTLVHVTVKYKSQKNRCPYPSISLNFDCSTHWVKGDADAYDGKYPWASSKWFGAADEMEYRVLPPETIMEEENDKFKCSNFWDHVKTASNRPRFQLKSSSWKLDKLNRISIQTCCIIDPPGISKRFNSMMYYWPETRDFTIKNEQEGLPSNRPDNARTRDFVPESAVVGKKPIDKDWPNQQTKDSVVGYRKGIGMSDEDAYNKPVTKEEYEAILKNEELVKNPADPDKHRVSNTSNTNSWSIINSCYVLCVSLLLIIISSLFVLHK